MDPQFEELAKRLTTELSQVFDERFSIAEQRLASQHKIYAEEMKDQSKRVAEAYGATLDAINRRLGELETKWDARIEDHERILSKHNRRITALERDRA